MAGIQKVGINEIGAKFVEPEKITDVYRCIEEKEDERTAGDGDILKLMYLETLFDVFIKGIVLALIAIACEVLCIVSLFHRFKLFKKARRTFSKTAMKLILYCVRAHLVTKIRIQTVRTRFGSTMVGMRRSVMKRKRRIHQVASLRQTDIPHQTSVEMMQNITITNDERLFVKRQSQISN